jgi:hypothetical protein
MPVDYVLQQNNLKNDGTYMATVRPRLTLDLDDVISGICRLETTVGEADVRSVLTTLFAVIEHEVLLGNSVCTPVANFGVSIRGVFADPDDLYDPTRHQIMARVRPGRRYRRTVRERAEVFRLEDLRIHPNPLVFFDVTSETKNGTLTPGGMGALSGRRLKFEPDDPAQGVFFLTGNGGTTRVEHVAENRPNKLIFAVPALAAGEYSLEVRARTHESKKVRGGLLEDKLTVVP